MARRIETKTTLFLNEKDYNTFINFSFLLNDLANDLNDEYIDILEANFLEFLNEVDVEMEEEDQKKKSERKEKNLLEIFY